MKRLLILFAALTLVVGCEKEKPAPKPTEQTLVMYFPWSGNLTSFFLTNIEDMKQVIAAGIPEDCRVVVFLMSNSTEGRLYELYNRKGITVEKELATYENPACTTAEGIAAILGDVKRFAPAKRYAMSIGSHGMAWLPARPTTTVGAKTLYGTTPKKEYWEHTDENGLPLSRWFGGNSDAHKTDVATLAAGIQQAGIKMEYLLFDVCYMSSIEVAYELRHVTEQLIASPHEIINYGFPYHICGSAMIGTPNYGEITKRFYDFYMDETNELIAYNCGTIAVTKCAELEALAAIMKQINQSGSLDTSTNRSAIQPADGYAPHRFYDLGDYVEQCCTDASLRAAFAAQLERTVPSAYRRHTPTFYANGSDDHAIRLFSGVMTSDPSTSPDCAEKDQTAWWKATH